MSKNNDETRNTYVDLFNHPHQLFRLMMLSMKAVRHGIIQLACILMDSLCYTNEIWNSPHPRKYWTFVMSWHWDQWRNDLVVICMKTCNLGIYLNFKNLSKTWHVNTQTNRYIMTFLIMNFHLLSNALLFIKIQKYAKKC